MHDWESLEEDWNIPGLSYLYLNGPDPFYTGRSWYDLPPNPLPGIQRSRQLLERVFAELNKVGFPPERCFLMGFSQGATMTWEFGSRCAHCLAGYLALSGHIYDVPKLVSERNPRVAKEGHWLMAHGTYDEHLSIEIARAQASQLKQAGFRLEYHEYPIGHTFDFKEEMPYIGRWLRARVH